MFNSRWDDAESRKIGFAWYVFDGDQEALRESMDQAVSYLADLAGMARRMGDGQPLL